MICSKCGAEIVDNAKICSCCGSEVEIMQQSVNASVQETEMLAAPDGNMEEAAEEIAETEGAISYCEECGAPIMENEKFCIKCGTPVHHDGADFHEEETSRENSGLKSELVKVFHKNKLFEFIWKYAAVFVVYYPLYLLMGRIDVLDGLEGILGNIGVVAFYGYYIGLIALYSKSNYLPMLIAFAIRFINSFILIFQPAGPISSLCRIAILIVAFLYIYKEFRETEEYRVIKTRLNVKAKICTQCGAQAKNNDVFCPQCGNRMEG